MSEIAATPSTSRKRSYDGTVVSPLQNDNASKTGLPTPTSCTPSLGAVLDRSRQASPALSTTSSSLTDLTDLTGEGGKTSTTAAVVTGAPAKKRKLTFAEKEVKMTLKKQEQEARDRQKADERLRRDEEKRLKDEEKRKKEEEKEITRRERELEKAEKQKVKDVEKQAKEAEKLAKDEDKRKKEEEKLKKERTQMRLGAFFIKPNTPSTPPTCTLDDVTSGVSSRRSSVASLEDSEIQDSEKTTKSGYEKRFPSFFIHPNTEVAPAIRFHKKKILSEILDANVSAGYLPQINDIFSRRKARPHFPRTTKSVRAVVDLIQGSSNAPIDLTGEKPPLQIESLLNGVPLKVLSFHEDVRPAYEGTYTRHVPPKSSLKLCRNPFGRNLPETDYDNDSEAEWEPPEPGDDDVDALDEDSGSEDEEEDMEGFLDDEDDGGRRGQVIASQVPISSGLCWQGGEDTGNEQTQANGRFNMKDLQMEIISGVHCFPIDPFSTKYWVQNSYTVPPARAQLSPNSANLMHPPRLPLHVSNQTNVLLSPGQPSANVPNQQVPMRASQKPLRLITNDLLPAFKQAVSGSDLNKVGLVEILKKRFPKVSKDVIRDTLATIAVRQGVKEVDKRWILNDPL